jgi:hypothetical protein
LINVFPDKTTPHAQDEAMELDVEGEREVDVACVDAGQLSPYLNTSYGLHVELDNVKES